MEFIRQEIEKSGFPLEIEVSTMLEEAGWEVRYSKLYFDFDEEKWREIDIVAERRSSEDSKGHSIKPYYLNMKLAIECKKSDDTAWVFFPRALRGEDIEVIKDVISLDFLNVLAWQSRYKLDPFWSRTRGPSGLEPSLIKLEEIVSLAVADKLKPLDELGITLEGSFKDLSKEKVSSSFKEVKTRKSRKAGLKGRNPRFQ